MVSFDRQPKCLAAGGISDPRVQTDVLNVQIVKLIAVFQRHRTAFGKALVVLCSESPQFYAFGCCGMDRKDPGSLALESFANDIEPPSLPPELGFSPACPLGVRVNQPLMLQTLQILRDGYQAHSKLPGKPRGGERIVPKRMVASLNSFAQNGVSVFRAAIGCPFNFRAFS